jgi:hypothetical protein
MILNILCNDSNLFAVMKVNSPVQKVEYTAVGIRCADNATPYIRKSWHLLRRQAAVVR